MIAVPVRGSAGSIVPAGDRALLVEPSTPQLLANLIDSLAVRAPAGVGDSIAGARTVLLLLDPDVNPEAVARDVEHRLQHPAPARAQTAASAVTIRVRYDGPDLHAVAGELGCSVQDVIVQHTGAAWHCDFIGFAPGFGYLRSADGRLAVPRLTRSRTAVPAGSVALADGYTAVYPRASPGGWRIIGTTDAVLWDLATTPPNFIAPGTIVRFEEDAGG